MPNARIINTPAQASHQQGTSHKQITVSSSAGTLQILGSFTFNADTEHVLIQVTGANVRVTFDGATDPDATTGFQYTVGKEAYWPIALAKKALLVRESADATIELQELNYKG